jgi:hypothetical protein
MIISEVRFRLPVRRKRERVREGESERKRDRQTDRLPV